MLADRVAIKMLKAVSVMVIGLNFALDIHLLPSSHVCRESYIVTACLLSGWKTK